MNTFENAEVAAVFDDYPEPARDRLLRLRALIFQVAQEADGVGPIEECLKWGEPSYLAKKGSTVRIAWKQATPDQYAMYFHCGTSLVETFRELYPETLRFEGNRAIIFPMDEPIPEQTIALCVELALTYHSRKHLPTLGV